MKKKYQQTDDFELVVTMCGQELLKQIKVECKHRGSLLKMILKHYQNIAHKKAKKVEQILETQKNDYEKQILRIGTENKEMIEKCKTQINELLNTIEWHKLEMKNLKEDSEFYKKKTYDVQRLYLAEQEAWKKRALGYMRESVSRPTVLSNTAYKLAVAR